MSEYNESRDLLNVESGDMKQLPTMLNVLTILTYVACAFSFFGSIYSYFTICKSVETLGSLDTEALGGGLLSKMVSGSVDLAMKQCDNKMIILIITLVSLLLCFLGALQMRKLRKTGFNVYTVGELLLPVATIFILGSNSIMGAAVVSGLLIPIIFVILYSTQYKYLRD